MLPIPDRYGFQKREKPSAMPNSHPLPQQVSTDWGSDQVRYLALDTLDERLQRYRLVQPKLERQMTQSLQDYGQISPVVVCQLDGQMVLVDGFKRLRAARSLKGLDHLNAWRLEVDEQGRNRSYLPKPRTTSSRS